MNNLFLNGTLFIKGGIMLINLDENNFSQETQKGIKLVEFYTDWCGFCQKQKSELEQMDKVWIGQVNAENSPNIAKKYNINAFPTFLLFKDGKNIERFSGMRSKEELMEKIMGYIS